MSNSRESKAYYVMVLSVIIGIIYLIYNFMYCKQVHIVTVLYGFFPFIILIVRSIIERRTNSVFFRTLTPAVLICLVLISISDIVLIHVEEKNTVVTSYLCYNRVLTIEDYNDNEYIKHFPSKIPTYVSDIDFEEWNKSKDDMGMYLTYKLPKEDINVRETSDYITSSQVIIDNYYEYISTKRLIKIPDRVANEMGIYGSNPISKDFIIYILDATSNNTENQYSFGVAINYTARKIMYFSQKW